MKHVGTWEFGKLRELRDGLTLDGVIGLADQRDQMSGLEAFDNGAAAFTVEPALTDDCKSTVKLNGREFVSEGAWDGLADRVRIPARVLRDLSPELLQHAIRDRYIPYEGGDVACLWGSEGVRGIVSSKFEHRSAMSTLNESLSAAGIDGSSDTLRATGWLSTPDEWSVELADIDVKFDVNTLGVPGPVPDDVVYPGWRLHSGDVGNLLERIESYLWRLVCNNGSSTVDMATVMRKIHYKGHGWQGSVLSAETWQEIIGSAKSDVIEVPTKDWFKTRYAKFNNKVPVKTVEEVFAALLEKDLRPDMAEKATASGFTTDKASVDQVFPNPPSIFEVLSGMWTTRWELAQAFGRVANDPNQDRVRLQNASGSLLLSPESSPFHELISRR